MAGHVQDKMEYEGMKMKKMKKMLYITEVILMFEELYNNSTVKVIILIFNRGETFLKRFKKGKSPRPLVSR